MTRAPLTTIVLAVALAVCLSACCGKLLQPGDPMYHHVDSLRYLAMPVTVPHENSAYSAEIGTSSHTDRILPAGTPVRIKSIRDTGIVAFAPVQDKRQHCSTSCSVAVSLEPDSRGRPFFDNVFAAENPVSDIDSESLRTIQQHRVTEGMVAEEVILAVGPPKKTGDATHVFYRDSQTRYEGEATEYWEYPALRVYLADNRVIDVTEDGEPVIEFESRCD